MRRPLLAFLAGVASLALVSSACGDDGAGTPGPGAGAGDGGSVTVYSGRSEELVGPILRRFEEETGIGVSVRYGGTAEMAATILEEGSSSPADVVFGQDAGALGALAEAGRLRELPSSLLDRVDPHFRSADGTWVGLSGRARVVIYNTDLVDEAELPNSIWGFTDPAWRGRLGWAPTNGSFQAFVTALRVIEGEARAEEWLRGIMANRPVAYEGNTPIVLAVAAGEVATGFVNHYYLHARTAQGIDMSKARNHYYTDGDPGALVNVAGAGILDSAANPEAALRLLEFLLGQEAQEYFATQTFEVPLAAGVDPPEGVPGFGDLRQPDLDLSDLHDLAGTLALLEKVGAL